MNYRRSPLRRSPYRRSPRRRSPYRRSPRRRSPYRRSPHRRSPYRIKHSGGGNFPTHYYNPSDVTGYSNPAVTTSTTPSGDIIHPDGSALWSNNGNTMFGSQLSLFSPNHQSGGGNFPTHYYNPSDVTGYSNPAVTTSTTPSGDIIHPDGSALWSNNGNTMFGSQLSPFSASQ